MTHHKLTLYFYGDKIKVYFSLHVVLCLSFHVHNCVKNVFKHVIFNVHDIEVMAEDICLPIRKLPKNTLFYLIMGHSKTRKFLLTILKTKHNVIILRTMSYNSSPDSSDDAIKKFLLFLLYL